MKDTEYKRIFSNNLKYYMALHGKNQANLMRDLGLRSSTLSNWCTGEKLPRMDKVQMLADYFHISKSDLIEEKSNPEFSNIHAAADTSDDADMAANKNEAAIAAILAATNTTVDRGVPILTEPDATYGAGAADPAAEFDRSYHLAEDEVHIVETYRKLDEPRKVYVIEAVDFAWEKTKQAAIDLIKNWKE